MNIRRWRHLYSPIAWTEWHECLPIIRIHQVSLYVVYSAWMLSSQELLTCRASRVIDSETTENKNITAPEKISINKQRNLLGCN